MSGSKGDPQEFIVGRITKTFGLGGELAVNLYDTFPYEDPTGECVYVRLDNMAAPLFFHSFRRMGRSKAVIVFDDLQDEFRASELVGREFFAMETSQGKGRADADESNDELYLEDLVDYTVRFAGAGEGRITGYVESEFNPLFEVEYAGREVLIPAADDFIVKISQRKKIVGMKLPEGLLDLR
ncbi:MAG: 16S rRNA processing protein RimM [Rikenellaceae bacterium]|jgi:16S rRNA processing protein RimM|nr:16S rRNA processing protein RimM [Rikenellaceae bacterium]